MIEQAIEAFVQEASETTALLEDQILSLEAGASSETVGEIFRGLHTVKGSGAMFGYVHLSRFTHHFENAFELVRRGELDVDSRLIDLCLGARDIMEEFLRHGGDTEESAALLASDRVEGILDRLGGLTGVGAAPPSKLAQSNDEKDAPTEDVPGQPRRLEILFKPCADALRNGMRPDLLIGELAELGATEIAFLAEDLAPLIDLDPTEATLGYLIHLTTGASVEQIEDVFIFADDAQIEITKAATDTSADPDADTDDGTQEAHQPNAAEPAAPPASRQVPVAPRAVPPKTDVAQSIRVASGRLDDMMDSLGELVIAQARLDAIADGSNDPVLESVAEEIERLVVGLRDATLSIRMLPVETVFGKFRRVVRDLAGELDKDVELVTVGGETEIDKNVIDRIGDPIVHMIRNSIDHGLEYAADRLAAGKPATGTIRLSARQEGGEILISIEDNGRGLDAEAIRARAVERGLIGVEDMLSQADIYRLIFEPGFSTAREVTAVSGRGVGMDAVKTTLDSLGGTVDVVSRKGRGTRMILRLPVTLAIIEGLRIKLGGSVYVIPLSSVEECVEMPADLAERQSGRSVLEIRNEMVPFLELGQLFNQPSTQDLHRRVVIVRVDGSRVGLVVDDILGQGQTVIKPLSIYHVGIPGLGGATILGDGRVALIIDVATLVRSAGERRTPGPRMAA